MIRPNPFQIFDKIYCIHLPEEKKRFDLLQVELSRFNLQSRTEYIHADPPSKNFKMNNMRRNSRGEFGVNLSQIKAIVHATVSNNQCPLFIEDDIVFAPDTIDRLNEAIEELPENWELLYLGGHPRGPIPQYQAKRYSKNLVKIGRFSFAECYAINNKNGLLLKFFDEWTDRISKEKAMYDIILGDFAAKCNAYCVYPLISKQYTGMSSISGKYDDKNNLIKRAWKNHVG